MSVNSCSSLNIFCQIKIRERETINQFIKAIMANLNVYAAIGILVIVASGAVMAREIDPIKAKNCEDKSKISWSCVNEVYESIFKTGLVTDICCHQLINLGDICHEALVKRTLESPIYKKEDVSTILSKAAQIWNECTSVTYVSPSPSP